MNTYLVSPDKPETDSEGTKVISLDEELAAERYVQTNHGDYDYEEECEAWVWLPGEIKHAKKYLVNAQISYSFYGSVAEDQED